jgi:hypothetical protein
MVIALPENTQKEGQEHSKTEDHCCRDIAGRKFLVHRRLPLRCVV